MIAPTNNNNLGSKTFSPRLMSLRSLIGMLFLINMALAMQPNAMQQVPRIQTDLPVSGIALQPGSARTPSDVSSIMTEPAVVEKQEWTLVAQKIGYGIFGRSKDSSLSTIKITYNARGKNEFRLINTIKGANKRFYFAHADTTLFGNQKKRKLEEQQNSFLYLTEEHLDSVNNCVALEMHASAKFGRVCNRRIFYLEQDGPRFMKFLVDQEKIQGLTMDHFKRDASRDVFGYTVTLMKDDIKNKAATALLWDANWMAQTSQLRVHTNDKGEVSFQISQLLDNRKFQITKISTYDEQLNRVHLTLARSEDVKRERERRANAGFWANVKNAFSINAEHRYLYLGANSDSKKFLLFLLETYHKDYSNDRENTEVFSKAAAAAIPTIFQDLEEEFVEEYLVERDTENADTIRRMTSIPEGNHLRRRRLLRLVEAESRPVE